MSAAALGMHVHPPAGPEPCIGVAIAMTESPMTQVLERLDECPSGEPPVAERRGMAHGPAGPAPAPATADEPVLFSLVNRRQDLVRAYPELDQVSERLGFGWDRTLAEQFPDPQEALLALARSAAPPAPARQADWSSYLVSELVSDLRDLHQRPLLRELRRLGILSSHLRTVHRADILLELDRRLRRLRQIVHRHVRHQLEVVFPRCIALEEALHGRRDWDGEEVTQAIRIMADGHTAIDRELVQASAVIGKALEECADPDLGVIRVGLDAIKAGLAVHAFGEMEILLPAAIAAEEQVHARFRV
jgi:iron-sulfur cluster repair protein YtfE (RIC family)